MLDTDTERSNTPLSPLLEVETGRGITHGPLTVFPLLAPHLSGLPYLLLTDALEAGTLRISEVGSGSVPDLIASNAGQTDVLVLDGEQLIGAKQNRITNRSILLGAQTETTIPVSCMEQGRWRFESDHFRTRPKPRQAPSRVRRKAREVEAEFASRPAHAGVSVMRACQRMVWSEIADMSADLGVHSDTGAMDEVYDRHTDSLDDWIARFPCAEGQVGLFAMLGGRPLGVDVVGSPAIYARLHDRILGGYCMDALSRQARGSASDARGHGTDDPPGDPVLQAAAGAFLSEVGRAVRAEAPTVGKGSYRLLSGAAIGAELGAVVDGKGAGTGGGGFAERLVHLSAFPGFDPGPGRRSEFEAARSGFRVADPIASPRQRRDRACRRERE